MTENATINQSDRNIAKTKACKFTVNHVKSQQVVLRSILQLVPPSSSTEKDFQDSSRIALK